MGLPVSVDGFSYLYQSAIAIGSIVYGTAGLWLGFLTASRFYPKTALAATILIWFGTNVVYYMLLEPSMSHMCSLFAMSLFLYLWIQWRPVVERTHWLTLGLVGGLIAIVRQPDSTILILPVLDLVLRRGLSRTITSRFLDMVMLGTGFLAVFSIQMAAWWLLYGSPLVSGYFYDDSQRFFWTMPKIGEVLFSLHHGLFSWHPIYLFGTVGLLFLAACRKRGGLGQIYVMNMLVFR